MIVFGSVSVSPQTVNTKDNVSVTVLVQSTDYERLEEKTYSQLQAFTHNQLTSEVI